MSLFELKSVEDDTYYCCGQEKARSCCFEETKKSVALSFGKAGEGGEGGVELQPRAACKGVDVDMPRTLSTLSKIAPTGSYER